MATTAGLAPQGFEPHQLDLKNPPHEIMERTWGLMARDDPTVSFEEYLHWAEIEREEERQNEARYWGERGPRTIKSVLMGRFSKGVHHEELKKRERAQQDDARQIALKEQDAMGENGRRNSKAAGAIEVRDPLDPGSAVTEEEWKTAARALRTASWGTLFFLITTDILGWSTTPFVFASVGFGPGSVLYLIFGLAAFASGWFIYTMFLKLDSSRFPLVSYGDLYLRVFGPTMRHFINFAQALCQFMTVAVLVLGCATTFSQLINNKVCFSAMMIIIMAIGMVLGSIRSLQRLGWICNLSVWINIVSFILILYSCSNYLPDYEVAFKSTLLKAPIEPVRTFAGPPPTEYQQQAAGFAGQYNGVNSMIYSWGGCLLFVAFLSEMRHPMDFWKAMLCAQLFICFVYIFFGAYVYSQWGQYAVSNIGNAVQPLALQQAGNVLGLIVSFIAMLLYFNIGMKTVYVEVFQSVFKFPAITTKKGRWMWYLLGPCYWIIAFIVASAVPNINGISGIVSSIFLVNFTYTFPGVVYLGYQIQMFAKLDGEGFNPFTRVTTRHDTGNKRWIRGFTKGWYITVPTLLYVTAGLVCCGIGTWAAVEGLIAVFGPGGTVATAFGCPAPV